MRSWEELPQVGQDRSKPPAALGSPAHPQGIPPGAC